MRRRDGNLKLLVLLNLLKYGSRWLSLLAIEFHCDHNTLRLGLPFRTNSVIARPAISLLTEFSIQAAKFRPKETP